MTHLSVPCIVCAAPIGAECTGITVGPPWVHESRVEAAAADDMLGPFLAAENERMVADEELRIDREVIAAATPGPWRQCGANRSKCQCGLVWSIPADVSVAMAIGESDMELPLPKEVQAANAAFIARARTRWEVALNRADKAEAELAKERAVANEACLECERLRNQIEGERVSSSALLMLRNERDKARLDHDSMLIGLEISQAARKKADGDLATERTAHAATQRQLLAANARTEMAINAYASLEKRIAEYVAAIDDNLPEYERRTDEGGPEDEIGTIERAGEEIEKLRGEVEKYADELDDYEVAVDDNLEGVIIDSEDGEGNRIERIEFAGAEVDRLRAELSTRPTNDEIAAARAADRAEVARLTGQLAEADAEIESLRGPACEGCGCAFDPETCWCGDGKHSSHEGHYFVPMGCNCSRVDYIPDKDAVIRALREAVATARTAAYEAKTRFDVLGEVAGYAEHSVACMKGIGRADANGGGYYDCSCGLDAARAALAADAAEGGGS